MKRAIQKVILFIVILSAPLTFLSSIWLIIVKKAGQSKINDKIFMLFGMLPILDHYYQPMINPRKHLTKSLREDRNLPGIDFNLSGQLELLNKFSYNDELLEFPLNKKNENEYYYDNGQYCAGDSEYLYNLIRYFKTKRIIEIGSGYSTLMVRNAVNKNKLENMNYNCRHICIEPYELPWLEKLEIELVREKVELLDKAFFGQLEANDILFIDSSHIIRPQGDVLFEYLEILPILKSGVLVHVHDIFTPKDYPDEWIYEKHLMWNEQYLLESFLTFNSEFKIIGSLNYLTHNYREKLAEKCPILLKKLNSEPGAIWLQKK